ncbi:hypothetical protein AX17_000696 [Amanita inopinata Kibby_2008]|nr:hypothetical protein AX17_000696 [Amanita inopinata Kibby_2008]
MLHVQLDNSVPRSTFNLQHAKSPLDTLVRKTSGQRRDQGPGRLATSAPQELSHNTEWHLQENPPSESSRHLLPEEQFPLQTQQPDSPLLHGRFARGSFATVSSKDNSSYLASLTRTSIDSRHTYQDFEYRYYGDDESVYSDVPPPPALRDSWHSATAFDAPHSLHQPDNSVRTGIEPNNNLHMRLPVSPNSAVPTVIVSSADHEERPARAGRTPIVASGTPNFSRPGRPPVIPLSDEEKRRVLDRNTRRTTDVGPSHNNEATRSPQFGHVQGRSDAIAAERSRSRSNSSTPTIGSSRNKSARSPSPLAISAPITSTPYDPATISNASFSSPMVHASPSSVSLPRDPPPRSLSPASIYSSYSYYPYESAAPSPAEKAFRDVPSPIQQQYLHPNPQAFSPQPPQSSSEPVVKDSQTPQEYLQLGIQCHESNRLQESAMYFEKSANEHGGCGMGMLMWGLALRHGWGCEKDEKRGFKWLRHATESAIEENARIGGGMAVQTELVLAIYEVGQCFFQGWGVSKDQKMAVSYYRVAARLGDADAQMDLAFCLANGRGCKKDRKEAAQWYRAAVAQGQSDIGLAWIYKDKYQ